MLDHSVGVDFNFYPDFAVHQLVRLLYYSIDLSGWCGVLVLPMFTCLDACSLVCSGVGLLLLYII